MVFNQCRGTRQALQTYLEIYTSGKVEIIEKRSKNFILGDQSDLGVEIALGKDNQPNSILIFVHIPAGELERIHFSEEMYQRKIMSIVRNMVPPVFSNTGKNLSNGINNALNLSNKAPKTPKGIQSFFNFSRQP